jgi:hypothetical protein
MDCHGLPLTAMDCHARHCKALINAAMGNFELTGLSAEDSRGQAAPHPSYPHQDLSFKKSQMFVTQLLNKQVR